MATNSTNENTIIQGSRMVMGNRYLFTQATPYASGTVTLATTWTCSFVGYAPCAVSEVVLKFSVRTLHDYTTIYSGTYAEAALYTGDFNCGKSTELERIGSVDILPAISAKQGATLASSGVKRVVIPIAAYSKTGVVSTGVSAGIPIWVVFGFYLGTGGTGGVTPVLNGADGEFGSGRLSQNTAALTLAPSSTTGYKIITVPSAQSAVGPAFALTYYPSLPNGGV